jgi:hypothetical protein
VSPEFTLAVDECAMMHLVLDQGVHTHPRRAGPASTASSGAALLHLAMLQHEEVALRAINYLAVAPRRLRARVHGSVPAACLAASFPQRCAASVSPMPSAVPSEVGLPHTGLGPEGHSDVATSAAALENCDCAKAPWTGRQTNGRRPLPPLPTSICFCHCSLPLSAPYSA